MRHGFLLGLFYIGSLTLTFLANPSAQSVAAQTIPSPSPTTIPELTCSGLTMEAEDGRLMGSFVIVEDATASGGRYIQTPATQQEQPLTHRNSSQNIQSVERAAVDLDNYAEYCFVVEQPGSYRIRGLVYASSGLNNSFFVSVDDTPADTYLWTLPVNSPQDSTYKLGYVTRNESNAVLEIELTTGEHIVRVSEREDGARLDRLELEYVGSNQAPTLNHPGDQRSYVGETIVLELFGTDPDDESITYDALGLPAGLAINPATGVISGTLMQATDEASRVQIYVDDGISFTSQEILWEVGEEPVLECGGLGQEAEAGELYRKMVIVQDPQASGGAYITNPSPVTAASIWTDSAQVIAASIDRKHRADFCVRVPWTGKYRLRAQVYAAEYFQNSFYVQIDGQPSSAYTWDIFPIGSRYVTDYLSQRGGADPVFLTLDQGDHIISFISRENSTRLDSFVIEPFDVSLVETEKPTESDFNSNLIQEAIARGSGQIVFTPFIAR